MLPLPGAPVGFVLGLNWAVTNDIGWSSGERAAGVLPGAVPAEGQFGWVLTDGFNLLPLSLSEGVVETGRELIWSATGQVSYDAPGVVLGRIVGEALTPGNVMLGLGTGNGAAVAKGFAQKIETLETADENAQSRITTIETVLASGSLAEASVIVSLEAQLNAINAELNSTKQVVVTADSAMAQEISLLDARFSASQAAGYSQLATAIASAESAGVTTTDELRAEFTAVSASAATALSQISVLTSDQFAMSTSVLNLVGQVDDPTTGLSATATAVDTITVRIDDSGSGLVALSSRATSLETTVFLGVNANATIRSDLTATAAAGVATASSLTTLSTTVGGHTATLSSYGSSIGGLQAKAGLRLDVNGRVTGWELNNSGASDSFRVVSSNFAIYDPAVGEAPVFQVIGGFIYGNFRMLTSLIPTFNADVDARVAVAPPPFPTQSIGVSGSITFTLNPGGSMYFEARLRAEVTSGSGSITCQLRYAIGSGGYTDFGSAGSASGGTSDQLQADSIGAVPVNSSGVVQTYTVIAATSISGSASNAGESYLRR